MIARKFLNITISTLVLVSLIFGGGGQALAQKGQVSPPARISDVLAGPTDPKDESKVPHYFGPNPNWALSPLTLQDAQVVITGNGADATAVATVGANGAVTDIIITNPGHDYTNAKVDILGSGTGASADVTLVKKGAVVAVNLVAPGFGGSGYTAPVVSFSSGTASATAYGGVEDNILVTDGGFGYTFPTVDFDMPDGPGGITAQGHATMDANGTIVTVVVDNPGSGYSTAPNFVIRDGTIFDPINPGPNFIAATATKATLSIQSIFLDTFGSGYNNPPTVTISDNVPVQNPNLVLATATAALDNGIISAITIKKPGSGYVTAGGIQKFTDALPGLCNPAVAGSCTGSKYIPLAVADAKMYNGIAADEYEIGLVQYRTSFSSSLPDTLVRGYVQLTACGNPGAVPLANAMLVGPDVATGYCGVTPPQYLGPVIAATKNKPVRIVFRNLLPTGSAGDLFLPVDSTLMGSGSSMGMAPGNDASSVTDGVRNPLCTDYPKNGMNCFVDNRATLHLHGGTTPWISDGTPHQWITPSGEGTSYPEGVSVENVPDMLVDSNDPASILCKATDDGCQTFYYTNQQSARLMFYHDHAWGITRLNVYAGEAAGYLISDDTEKALLNSGTIPTDQIPLVIQDKTFVPQDTQLYNQYDANGNVVSYGQDPTWDAARWGGYGNFWYHHVYMPAQNPGDPSGMSAYGRWMYGPWFWPPAANTVHGPIPNPYYNPACNLDDPATWQYQTDPFCEPELIPGTPNISVGMEQFNDTPIVNGVAYPTLTLEPKTYRFRILSAANDRFFNFQWYVGDNTTASTSVNSLGEVIGATEVALNPAELALAQTDPNIFPTPNLALSPAGPDWIQIGTEGGFLPAPVVVDGQQVTTWITDPTRFDVGNVDKHSLLLAPAERADVIVDFSKFAGKTLILYNDAPAAFPARVASYDYYTGAPDLSPNGAPGILPGYGPNTRTIMQVKIAPLPAAPAFNLAKLQAAFRHNANGTGVFESGQHPIIVGQAAYNSAYGTSFAASGNCTNSTSQRCDGFVRVNDTTIFGFNTLKAPTTKMIMPLQPKAIHDEMNSTTFDEFGRMQATLGVEAQPPVPGAQNVVLYPYVNPPTELIDATNLPKAAVTYDATTGQPVSDVKMTAISSAADGTQIWRITHNGVDTHPIHFHLYDVQVVNRVTWDNIIIPTEPSELGWKDTVRISPLEDTIVALRPLIPQVPFELPNAIRPLSPMLPVGDPLGGNPVDPQGNPTAPISNQLANFGWEYVYHCHILSHEEMDMMRPVLVALPPIAPDGLAFNAGVLTWNDNSINETAFRVERSSDGGTTWTGLGSVPSPLDQPNTHGARNFIVPAFDPNLSYQYRVVALNTVGYIDGTDPNIAGFPEMTVQSVSEPLLVGGAAPETPVLTATYTAGIGIVLNWSNVANETGYVVQRSLNGGAFADLTVPPLAADVTTYTDAPVADNNQYAYQVYAFNLLGNSPMSNVATVATPPAAPSNLTAVYQDRLKVVLTWTDNSTYETGFKIERVEGDVISIVATLGPGITTFTDTTIAFDGAYVYTVTAFNASGSSLPSNVANADAPPLAPTTLAAVYQAGPQVGLTWYDNSTVETDFSVQRCAGATCTDFLEIGTAPTNGPDTVGNVSYFDTSVLLNNVYRYRVAARNLVGLSDFSNIATIDLSLPPAPALGTITNQGRKITVTWGSVPNVTGYTLEWSTVSDFSTIAGTGSTNSATTSFTTGNLTRRTTYYFRVRAEGAIGPSAWAIYPPFPLP